MTATENGAMSAAEILRKPFPAEHIGKLPRVTCPKCSDKNNRSGKCDEHEKRKCGVCQAFVSERHIHLDYVGHADVTSRLLEADPEWEWRPKLTDPDPAALAAAIATNNPDIVRMVTDNAPPKFETDERGNPVGLWIVLTVGGVARLGFGSCPSGQNDAEKVLIGDALRNAAMRFGVALDLWAKGDRADPSAENPSGSGGQVQRRSQQAASRSRQQDQDAETIPQAPAEPDPAVTAEWDAKAKEITEPRDADALDAELRELFRSGQMDATTANAIRKSIQARKAAVAQAPATAQSPEVDSQVDPKVAALADRAGMAETVAALQEVWVEIRAQRLASGSFVQDGKAVTLSQYVTARKAELQAREPEMAGAS